MTLTPTQTEMIEERLGDILHFEKDNIAASLGIPADRRELTDEESDRIIAECDRLYKPFFTQCVLGFA